MLSVIIGSSTLNKLSSITVPSSVRILELYNARGLCCVIVINSFDGNDFVISTSLIQASDIMDFLNSLISTDNKFSP